MTQPDFLDVVELLVDLPETRLQAGDQGTIVEVYDDCAYEVEFSNSQRETQVLLTLKPEQFVVVWQNATKAPNYSLATCKGCIPPYFSTHRALKLWQLALSL